jgi:transposase-like protein
MPKKTLPSEKMQAEIFNTMRAGMLDLSTIMVKTASLWVQQLLEREREVFLGRDWGKKNEAAIGYANGYEPKRIASAEGALEVHVPQVRGAESPFHPMILDTLKHRTDNLELLALKLYVGGLSHADIAEVFRQDLHVPHMSESVVAGLCKQLESEYETFNQRDLSKTEILYLFLDGIYLRTRRGKRLKEAVLVARGYTVAGHPVLLGLGIGPRESYESWRDFLRSLRKRNLNCPLLVTSDLCPGLLRAAGEVFHGAAHQPCLFHLRRILMSAVPDELALEVQDRLEDVLNARDYEAAKIALKSAKKDYAETAVALVEKLEKYGDRMLTYYKFPQAHWKRIRTSNCIERSFLEVRRRTKIIPSFMKVKSCLMLCHAVLIELSRKKRWKCLTLKKSQQTQLDKLRRHLVRYEKDILEFQWKEAA